MVFGLGLAVIFVFGIIMFINWLISEYLLSEFGLLGIDFMFLCFIFFIVVIVLMVQLVEMVVEKYFLLFYSVLGIFLLLIMVNCVIFGGLFFMVFWEYNLFNVVVFGLGGGFGWFLVIIVIVVICEKICYFNVLFVLCGLGMVFIFIGLMGIVFMSFMGIDLVVFIING